MPQPAANDAAAQRLVALYDEAHARLLAEYADVVDDPSRTRQTARLRELIRTTEAVADGLVDASRTWITGTLPELHAAGAAAAAEIIGTSFAWTAPHVEAIEQFAARTWDDVAPRLQELRADTRAALRSQVRDATRSALLENRTAVQAGRELATEAARQGIGSVTYSNGARHTIADWADSTIRATTAEAYNQGTLTQCRTDGIEQVEYLDGDGCCVGPGHSVGPLANGMIVDLDDVVYLSHPRCRRALAPSVPAQLPSKASRDIGPPRGTEAATIAPRPLRTARTGRAGRTARRPRVAAS